MKSVRENTKERIARDLHNKYEELAVKFNWKTQECCQTPWETLPTANQKVMLGMAEYVLELFLSPEEVEKIIKDSQLYLLASNRKSEYSNILPDKEVKELVSALSTTLKPSWTELELDKILPEKNKEHQEDGQDCGCIGLEDYTPCEIRNQAISDCREALIKNV